jgi:two-component system, NarL family, response regulator
VSSLGRRITVLCVDEHRLVREGLALIIGRDRDLEVVGTAATGEEAVASYLKYRPDVTLMDLQLPHMSGFDAIRTIRHEDPQARIIVLTAYAGDEDIYRALEAGASTYLLKDTPSDDLLRVVHEVHDGKRPIGPDVRECLAERARYPTLSLREIEVIRLVAQGMGNKNIAVALGISEGTVHVHLRNIFAKLGVTDRMAVVNLARRRGLIHFS